jgi:hypothetical protein
MKDRVPSDPREFKSMEIPPATFEGKAPCERWERKSLLIQRQSHVSGASGNAMILKIVCLRARPNCKMSNDF